jgi:hypothetical protein
MDYVTRIMAELRIKLTGAVDTNLKMGLFAAVDDFCQQTDAWKEDIIFTTVAYAPDVVYDLVPTKGVPLRLLDLYVTEGRLGRSGMMQTPGVLTLTQPWSAGVGMTAVISLHPVDPTAVANDFPDIPEWMYERFWQAFVDGTIMKLAAEQDKPYTNNSLVAWHGQKFRNWMAIARADGTKANVASAQAWRFPSFA